MIRMMIIIMICMIMHVDGDRDVDDDDRDVDLKFDDLEPETEWPRITNWLGPIMQNNNFDFNVHARL